MARKGDDVFLYVDMTEEGDILKVSTTDICKHRLYERERLEHVARRAEIAELQWNINFHFALNLRNYKEMNCLVDKKILSQLQRQFWQNVSLVTASWEISLQTFFGKLTIPLTILRN